jgi:hypothetical protein
VTITRDELADHFLARLRPEQLESYLTRRIIEHACRKEGITLTSAEVDAALKGELEKSKLADKDFRARLRERHLTLRQWKEDVLRPQLLLKKLWRRRAKVKEKDLRNLFTARYGRRVECEFLAWPISQKDAAHAAGARLRRGEVSFDELAPGHRPAQTRPLVIGRHGMGHAELEEAAFALRPGEVSRAIEVGNAVVILRCKHRIAADRETRFEDVREELTRALQGKLLRMDEKRFLEKVKAEARARLLWRPPADEAVP